MGLLQQFLQWNSACSRRIEGVLNRWTGRESGVLVFRERILPGLLKPGLRVLDVGGGKNPILDVGVKQQYDLRITGVDICETELRQAPAGVYDDVVVGDIANVALPGRFDLIVSNTVLEHVEDTSAALANMSAALTSDGAVAHFMPNRHALFATAGRWMGNGLVRRLLHSTYPETRRQAGFPAYYNRCTPSAMTRLCRSVGLTDIEVTPFFASEYFRFFTPLHLLDLVRQNLTMWCRARMLCETFAIVARREAGVEVERIRKPAA